MKRTWMKGRLQRWKGMQWKTWMMMTPKRQTPKNSNDERNQGRMTWTTQRWTTDRTPTVKRKTAKEQPKEDNQRWMNEGWMDDSNVERTWKDEERDEPRVNGWQRQRFCKNTALGSVTCYKLNDRAITQGESLHSEWWRWKSENRIWAEISLWSGSQVRVRKIMRLATPVKWSIWQICQDQHLLLEVKLLLLEVSKLPFSFVKTALA